ncbi:MAG: hypothetical protein O3A37_06570 [Planctomycetota bacterium]|jgi:hypothetical protein|nr:hypothetical protein [Planctomycetota bacterium]
MSRPDSFVEPAAPRGITLLEVLIACGVLVLGLASVAALLPAAGSRLGQATVEDRGGVLAANARAEVQLRGLLTADLFQERNKTIAFGEVLDQVPPLAAQKMTPPRPEVLAERISDRDFLLEDQLLFEPPTTAETPLNSFTDGRRAFKESLSWGASLAPAKPDTIGAIPGSPAVLTIAVFRAGSEARRIQLVPASTDADRPTDFYRMQSFDPGLLKSHLKGCSYVIAPPMRPDQSPRWFRIQSSWVTDGVAYVAFTDPGFGPFAGNMPAVIAFDKLVRVDQYTVTLE